MTGVLLTASLLGAASCSHGSPHHAVTSPNTPTAQTSPVGKSRQPSPTPDGRPTTSTSNPTTSSPVGGGMHTGTTTAHTDAPSSSSAAPPTLPAQFNGPPNGKKYPTLTTQGWLEVAAAFNAFPPIDACGAYQYETVFYQTASPTSTTDLPLTIAYLRAYTAVEEVLVRSAQSLDPGDSRILSSAFAAAEETLNAATSPRTAVSNYFGAFGQSANAATNNLHDKLDDCQLTPG